MCQASTLSPLQADTQNFEANLQHSSSLQEQIAKPCPPIVLVVEINASAISAAGWLQVLAVLQVLRTQRTYCAVLRTLGRRRKKHLTTFVDCTLDQHRQTTVRYTNAPYTKALELLEFAKLTELAFFG